MDLFYDYCKNNNIKAAKLLLANNITQPDLIKAHKISCQNNNMDIIKWLVKKIIKNGEKNKILEMCNTCCESEYSEIIGWIIETFPNIDISSIFYSACGKKYLKTANNLFSIAPNLIEDNLARDTFNDACCTGCLDMAKLLYLAFPEKCVLESYAFRIICKYGHVQVAKWVLENIPNVITCESDAFGMACGNGNLETAIWLLKTFPHINLYPRKNQPIQTACRNGHLEVAKWVLTVAQDIDIKKSIDSEEIYKICKNNNQEIIKWLVELNPDFGLLIIKKSCMLGMRENLVSLSEILPDIYTHIYNDYQLMYSITKKPQLANWLEENTVFYNTRYIIRDKIGYVINPNNPIKYCKETTINDCLILSTEEPDIDMLQSYMDNIKTKKTAKVFSN
jgi:hypothetical protein